MPRTLTRQVRELRATKITCGPDCTRQALLPRDPLGLIAEID